MSTNNKYFWLSVTVLFGFLHLGVAQAALVGFSPSSQTVVQGSSASVDLVISGLGTGPGSDILTTFNLDISYNNSILGFQDFIVGSGITGLNPSGLWGDINSLAVDSGSGSVTVKDLSFDPDTLLELLQPDSFVLGTLEFATLGVGTSDLVITFASLGGPLVGGLATPLVLSEDPGTGSITVSAIPVPAAVWLFGTALLGLVGFGKRNKSTGR